MKLKKKLITGVAIAVTIAGGIGGFQKARIIAHADSIYTNIGSYLNAQTSNINYLNVGQQLSSPNGHYTLRLQTDGNLVIYDNSKNQAVWASGTNGKAVTRLVMQFDGNLVLYNNAQAVWNSNTSGSHGAFLKMQNDGNLVIYDVNANAKWASNTNLSPKDSPDLKAVGFPLTQSRGLIGGQNLFATQELGGAVNKLVLQIDGNLVLYSNSNKVLWASGTNGKGATRLSMQKDGNLVLYTNDNRAVWASGTNGKGATRLILQNDGNLVLYTNDNRAVWASGTNMSGD